MGKKKQNQRAYQARLARKREIRERLRVTVPSLADCPLRPRSWIDTPEDRAATAAIIAKRTQQIQ